MVNNDSPNYINFDLMPDFILDYNNDNNQDYFEGDVNVPFSFPLPESRTLTDRITSVATSLNSIPKSNHNHNLECRVSLQPEQDLTTLYPQESNFPQIEDTTYSNSETLPNQFHFIDNDYSVANSNTPLMPQIPLEIRSNKKRKITRVKYSENSKITATLKRNINDLSMQLIKLYQTYLPADTLNVKLQSLNAEVFAIYESSEDQSAENNANKVFHELNNVEKNEQKRLIKKKKNNIMCQKPKKTQEQFITNLKKEKKILKHKILEFHRELVNYLIIQNTSLSQANESLFQTNASINQENQYLKQKLKKFIIPENSNYRWNNFNGLK